MNILGAEKNIKALMEQYLPTWDFRWDRATRRFGCCHQSLKRITLSKKLVELNSWEQVKDTALHEIAHALVGAGHGHNEVWKAKCVELGCRPERCYGTEVIRPKKKYKGTCPNCGRTVYVCRKRDISCGRCSKTYDPRYRFEWVENN